MINKRIFGADIPTKIKGILKARQIVAQSSTGGNLPSSTILLPKNIYDLEDPTGMSQHEVSEFLPLKNINFLENGGSLADLYSRTPFIRMWTAVGLS